MRKSRAADQSDADDGGGRGAGAKPPEDGRPIDEIDAQWLGRLAGHWSSPSFDDLMTRSGKADGRLALFDMLFRNVLKGLGPDETPENVHFLSVPAPTLNAFITRSPRTGTTAVVANQDMIGYVGATVHLVLGLIALRTPEGGNEYCNHAMDRERFDALKELADVSLRRLPSAMASHPAIYCIGDRNHTLYEFHDVVSCIAEMCVFMHELGHMALGHLDRPDSATTIESTEAELLGFARQRELDADWFAVKRMIEVTQEYLRPDEVLLAFGCFFAFLHMRDAQSREVPITTHPPGMTRWRSIYDRFGAVPDGSLAFRLEHLMRYLEEVWA